MRCFRRSHFWRSLRRRLSAGLVLLAYVLTAFGVPLPAGDVAVAACGCVSDEVCQSGGCCCKRPPRRTASCCTGKPGCTMPCCQHDGQAPCDSDACAPTSGVRWVNSISAMQCRGHSTLWVSAGVVLPVPPLAALPVPQPIGRLVHADESASAADHIPPVPPPRLVQL